MEVRQRVLVYLGEGVGGKAPQKIQDLLAERGVDFGVCYDFREKNLSEFDMIIVPGGSSTQQYNFIAEQVNSINPHSCSSVQYLTCC